MRACNARDLFRCSARDELASGVATFGAQVEASHTGRALRSVLAAGRSNAYAARG